MRRANFGPLDVAVPIVGQGTWELPLRDPAASSAKQALRRGIELGMVHIDTAEMYGDGAVETLVGEAIAGMPRESLFIVSKVLPSHATYKGTISACDASLRRLQTDYLDAYLLHWPGSHPLGETMGALEQLARDGKIRALGVSNFDVEELAEARSALRRYALACNQVLYHLGERGIEHRLAPYCRANDIAIVAYSPFGKSNFPSASSVAGRTLTSVGQRHGATARQAALAFLTREPQTFAIPKAARADHVAENAAAGDLMLSAGDVAEIQAAFPLPPPRRRLATS
ncbi:MAG: aldo/keto reductase [Candidatus Eremiobacteraeota bacterium]|nr:aldo/keto reductase [Candidatus Eremiobacteraeota bacterium]